MIELLTSASSSDPKIKTLLLKLLKPAQIFHLSKLLKKNISKITIIILKIFCDLIKIGTPLSKIDSALTTEEKPENEENEGKFGSSLLDKFYQKGIEMRKKVYDKQQKGLKDDFKIIESISLLFKVILNSKGNEESSKMIREFIDR
jgi:hypothetical protein